MLIIAIAHGSHTDPFTTSTNTLRDERTKAEPFSPDDAKACRDYICKDKGLLPEWIDEILVVYLPEYDADPEVMHHFSSIENDFGDEDEEENGSQESL